MLFASDDTKASYLARQVANEGSESTDKSEKIAASSITEDIQAHEA